MEKHNGDFYNEVEKYLDALEALAPDDNLPFYLSGYPTNEAVLKCLSVGERFLHGVAVQVREGLPLHLKIDPSKDHFFPERIISLAQSILEKGRQKGSWAL